MVAQAGISTLGIKLGYAVNSELDKDPQAYTQLERVNSIGGIDLSTEQIDASAVEDLVSRYVSGRQDTGGTWDIVFNVSDEVIALLESLIASYKEMTSGQEMWFTVWSPRMAKAFCVVAQVPENIPMPEVGQNSLLTITMSLTIERYVGLVEAIEPQPK